MNWSLTVGLMVVAVAAVLAADDKPKSFRFDKASLDKLPAGWKGEQTGKGSSVWKVVADDTAPSKTGFVLAQTTADRDALFNLCVAEDTSYQDVEITVAFKAVKGEKDQGGGVVWRYQDADNYYIARMNPLEDNFRVYKVVAGKRAPEFQNAEVKAKAGEWHTLKVTMKGDQIECSFDGKKYLEVKDDTFTKPGKVGLWTKADAQTYFDDFQVQPAK
jgi:3-keto-disaccharide hydrolase